MQESKTLILKLQIAKVSNKKKIKNLRKEVHQEAKADKRVPCPNKSKYQLSQTSHCYQSFQKTKKGSQTDQKRKRIKMKQKVTKNKVKLNSINKVQKEQIF